MINKISAFFYRLRNKNKYFTLIARDCIGGIVYHQLKLRFLTPTINLFFTPIEFNKLCLHLKEYIPGELVELKDDEVSYPVGLLYPAKDSEISDPVRIDFMHYATFDEAFKKWNERKVRINWDNIFVVSSFCYPKEIADFSDELTKDWNNIKYKKVMLVTQSQTIGNHLDRSHFFTIFLQQPISMPELGIWIHSPPPVHSIK